MSHLPLPQHLQNADAEHVLRFVVSRAGLYSHNASSIKEIADLCGLRPDILSRFFREGHFTPRAAAKIENGLGREYVKWEWLVKPCESVKNGSMY